MKKIVAVSTAVTALTAAVLSACVVQTPPAPYYPPPGPAYAPPPLAPSYAPDQGAYDDQDAPPVVSVYVDPPLEQPEPIQVDWAPPPMLVETPPPPPYDSAVWTGGYWVWEGNWVWAHGRWAPPPRPGYAWVNPYYEHRGDSVIFVNGFWAAPGVRFVPPAYNVRISIAIVAPGVRPGPRPVGPAGVFVPPPPGSHHGLIIPAPIGTAPAVVTSAPPVVREGMHITLNNTSINNRTTNVSNITNVTIVAPAGATGNGQSVNAAVPGQANLAAGLHPVVNVRAPEPSSAKPIPAYVPGHAPASLPPPQAVHAEAAPAPQRLQAPVAPVAPQTPAAAQPAQSPFRTAPQAQQQPAASAEPAPRQTVRPIKAKDPSPPTQAETDQIKQNQQQAQQPVPAVKPAQPTQAKQNRPSDNQEKKPDNKQDDKRDDKRDHNQTN